MGPAGPDGLAYRAERTDFSRRAAQRKREGSITDLYRPMGGDPMKKRILGILAALATVFLASGANASWLNASWLHPK